MPKYTIQMSRIDDGKPSISLPFFADGTCRLRILRDSKPYLTISCGENLITETFERMQDVCIALNNLDDEINRAIARQQHTE